LVALALAFCFGMRTGAAARKGPGAATTLAAASDLPVPTLAPSENSREEKRPRRGGARLRRRQARRAEGDGGRRDAGTRTHGSSDAETSHPHGGSAGKGSSGKGRSGKGRTEGTVLGPASRDEEGPGGRRDHEATQGRGFRRGRLGRAGQGRLVPRARGTVQGPREGGDGGTEDQGDRQADQEQALGGALSRSLPVHGAPAL